MSKIRIWFLTSFLLLGGACFAQDKTTVSLTGGAGDGVQAGLALEVPIGRFGILSEAAGNTVHGWSATESGMFWFNDRFAGWGGTDLESPHDGFVGGVIAGRKWDSYLAYYPRSRGATAYAEYELRPGFWLGGFGGYLHGPTAMITVRFEMWRKK